MNQIDQTPLFENVFCPLCGQEDYKVLSPALYPTPLDREHLLSIYKSSSEVKLLDQLVECKGCELVQLSPRVHHDIIMASYSGAVDPKFVEQDSMRIATFTRALRKIFADLNLTPSKNIKTLDIGCAGGAFPKAAHDFGLSIVGIEPSRWLSEQGRKRYGLDLRAGTLEEHPFEENSFDLVTLWDVIEHLTAPEKTLAEIKRILKPGGHLLVNYPDFGSWQAKLLGKNWPFLLSVHLYYFTPKTIQEFLQKAGYEVVKLRPHWQMLELGYVLKRAGSYFGFFNYVARLTEWLHLSRLPILYNVGQTQVVAKVKK